jgi:hypothetical protein
MKSGEALASLSIVLFAGFVVLELAGKISWSWLHSPVWLPIASYVAFWIIIIAIFSITGYVVARLLHVRA